MQERTMITRRTPFEELPEWMSPDECRAYLGLGRSLIYDELRRGELHCVKFGRVIRVPKAALGEYLSQNSTAASGATESGGK